jgi:ABC-type arginine/histidine transport system permease subunit
MEQTQEIIIYDKTPRTVLIRFRKGDAFVFPIVFNKDLTGYTYDAAIIPVLPATPIAMTVNVIDLLTGSLEVVLSAVDSAMLVAGGVYKWYFKWIVSTRSRTLFKGDAQITE